MYTSFEIKDLSSWADIEISSDEKQFSFSASKIFCSSFTDLLAAIIQTWKGENNCVSVHFDLEAEGWLDMLFINYPKGVLKIEVYHSVDWYQYEEIFKKTLPPVPVFAAITDHHNIGYEIINAMERYSRSDFDCWDCSFFDNELPKLKKLLRNIH